MKSRFCLLIAVLLVASPVFSASAIGPDAMASLKSGKADLQSAGVMAFGPDGILFVGDWRAGKVFALDTADRTAGSGKINVDRVDAKVAAMLGSSPEQVAINDMVVNPISKKAYLSVSRGRGADAAPVIVTVDPEGKLAELSLDSIRHSSAMIPNTVAADAQDRRGRPLRSQAITDLAYLDGKVIVAGLSNEEFASNLRSIPFPFNQIDPGSSVEIYHGNHGQWETRSPVRTFIPYEIQAEPHLLAAYTCTPLVKFPVNNLKAGAKVVGTTIAELGNRNTPLDMVMYKQGGQDHVLMSNTARGVMKMSTQNIEKYDAITDRVADAGTAGLPYETIASLEGVQQLDLLDGDHAVILRASGENGPLNLETVALP